MRTGDPLQDSSQASGCVDEVSNTPQRQKWKNKQKEEFVHYFLPLTAAPPSPECSVDVCVGVITSEQRISGCVLL